MKKFQTHFWKKYIDITFYAICKAVATSPKLERKYRELKENIEELNSEIDRMMLDKEHENLKAKMEKKLYNWLQ